MPKPFRELQFKAAGGSYRCKITDGWLPIPEALLTELGWVEGQQLELFVINDTQLVVREKDLLNDTPITDQGA